MLGDARNEITFAVFSCICNFFWNISINRPANVGSLPEYRRQTNTKNVGSDSDHPQVLPVSSKQSDALHRRAANKKAVNRQPPSSEILLDSVRKSPGIKNGPSPGQWIISSPPDVSSHGIHSGPISLAVDCRFTPAIFPGISAK